MPLDSQELTITHFLTGLDKISKTDSVVVGERFAPVK